MGLTVLEPEDKIGGGDVDGLPLECDGGLELLDAACPDFRRNPLKLGDILTPRGRRGSRGGGHYARGGRTGMPSPLSSHFFDSPPLLYPGFDCLQSWRHDGRGEKKFLGEQKKER